MSPTGQPPGSLPTLAAPTPVGPFGTILPWMATTVAPKMTQAALPRENGLIIGVELRGLEPLTPTLPAPYKRAR